MIAVYKYPLQETDTQVINMPWSAAILSVDKQDGQLCIWAEVDTDDVIKDKIIHIYGTGNPIVVDAGVRQNFVGTVQSGIYVWHIFEVE
jgi:hypothetical protein